MTQINMSIYYQKSKVNKKLSIQLVDEAITNLLSFVQISYIQDYLKEAVNVLKNWNIDVGEYLNPKMVARNKDEDSSLS